MKKNTKDINFQKMFQGKKIPILTLDERWHQLFPDYDKPAYIKQLENKINELMRKQGKIINDLKDMKVLKKQLMSEIITHMDVNDSKAGKQKAKKLDRNQKLIKELSEKMKKAEDDLVEIPYIIKEVNEQLIIESAKLCYQRLNRNNQHIIEIAKWVSNIREELKEKILEKQDMELKNTEIYSYMHDLLGPELLQELDDNIKANS
ncbi:MAG: hypothetical protein K0S41_3336 [Anaerocolumna sp.]|jgi:hypothetical protein|nr:hypothetical protein [Anaerocolumna sp.]